MATTATARKIKREIDKTSKQRASKEMKANVLKGPPVVEGLNWNHPNVQAAISAGVTELKAGSSTRPADHVSEYISALAARGLTMPQVKLAMVEEHRQYHAYLQEKGLPIPAARHQHSKDDATLYPFSKQSLTNFASACKLYNWKCALPVMQHLRTMHASLDNIIVVSFWIRGETGGKPNVMKDDLEGPSIDQLRGIIERNRIAKKTVKASPYAGLDPIDEDVDYITGKLDQLIKRCKKYGSTTALKTAWDNVRAWEKEHGKAINKLLTKAREDLKAKLAAERKAAA